MKPNIFEQWWRWLARPGLLAVLVVALLAVLLLGAVLPQIPDAAPDSTQLAEWRALAQARYGVLNPLLDAVGAYRIYRTPLLWALLALLGVATLACVIQRQRQWRTVFSQPAHLPDVLLDAALHAAVVASWTGDDAAHLDILSGIAVDALRRFDYRVRVENSPEVIWLRGDRNRLAPLGTLAEHLAVLIILTGVCVSVIFGWRETLDIEPGATAQVGHGTGIALRNDGFAISRYADGSPATYTVQCVIETGPETESRAIGVNRPAVTHGTRFYLQSYRPAGTQTAVTLLAVHDPGYGVVVGGGLVFLAAIVVALYFAHSTVHLRITKDGLVRLAGWADPRAYNFDREFAEVATGLRREFELRQHNTSRSGAQ